MIMARKMEETILVQEREELMISASCGSPILRIAHFLTPSHHSTDGSAFHLPSKPVSCSDSNTKESLIKINFCRWKNPQNDWKEWVDLMYSKHQMLWKKAGIFEAVLNSKYTIHRDDELLHAFAARWCSETNTFVFPWGEATLTLEDIMMLGGYSVLGDPVFSPLETQKMKEIERKLEHERSEIINSKSKKACHGAWLGKFMNSGNEIEHEAFLVYWLSSFVFPLAHYTITKRLFPIAIHLAKGTKIALAPSVLASIYSDLNAYKKAKCREHTQDILVSSQFSLILIWVWERFPILRPNPENVSSKEPTFARWHSLRRNGGGIVTNVIDKAADSFEWRPCTNTTVGESFLPRKINGGQEQCLSVTSGNKEVEAMIRCLRVSELVGIDTNCIEQYLPHRVARQFGLDQDIPAVVKRAKSDQHLAWENYTRPINDRRFCIPSRVFESNVTIRYLKWWKKSISAEDGVCEGFVDRMNSNDLKKRKLLDSARKKPEEDVCAPAGNASKEHLDYSKNSNIGGSETDLKLSRGFGNGVSYKRLLRGMALKSAAKKSDVDDSVPSGYPSKCSTAIARSLDIKMESICPQAMQSNIQIPSKEVSSKAFVEKISNHVSEDEGKSIPSVSKDSIIELEARILNLETILARYKSDRGLP